MANKKEETVGIKLKKDQPKSIEITVGNNTITATKNKVVKVPLSELQMWLNTGRFDKTTKTNAEIEAAKSQDESESEQQPKTEKTNTGGNE